MRRTSVYNWVVAVVMILPLVVIVAVSVNPSRYSIFPPEGFSLTWYATAFTNLAFVNALLLSLQIALISALVSLALGTSAAFALRRLRSSGGRVATAALATTARIVPEVLLGLGLFIYFGNVIPVGLGAPAIVFGHVLVCLPIAFQVVVSSLAQQDRSLQEAAATLGAGPVATFFRVTIPMLAPGLIGAGLLTFVFSFDNVNISLFLAAPGESPLPIQMYSYLDFRSDPMVAAMSSALVALGVVIFFVANRVGALRFLENGALR